MKASLLQFSLGFALSASLLAQGHEDSPLLKSMSTINRDMRNLGRQYTDPAKKQASLDLVAEMTKSAETAKTLIPSQAEKLAPAEKTKFLATYQKDIEGLITELGTLKETVEAGQGDKIKLELDKINHMKMDSHKELGVKMDGQGGPRGPGGRSRGPGAGPGGAGGDHPMGTPPGSVFATPSPASPSPFPSVTPQ